MNNIRKELIEKIQELEYELEKTRHKLVKINDKNWEPEGGEFYISPYGECKRSATDDESRAFGVERPTDELAHRAVKEVRTHNRLRALS